MAIAINGSGTMTGISVGGLPDGIVDSGTLATNSVDSDELINGAIDSGHLASGVGGKIVQVVNTQTGALATGTTVLPFDDTIPQNSEGDEYLTLAITPTNASNVLRIQACFLIGHSTANGSHCIALFQDSTAGALATMDGFTDRVSDPQCVVLDYRMAAGTTSSTTFKIRGGAGGAGTTTINGRAGARLYGGVNTSSLTITEISA